jgi:cytochrome c oxidase assembly protein subunit 11
MNAAEQRRKNRRTLVLLSGLAIGMFGFGFALVPLYGLLCQLTGIQSVEQRSNAGAQTANSGSDERVTDRWVTVKFDGTVHPELPWAFRPLESKLRVRPGEMHEVRFLAENRASSPVTGQAIPSVVPWQATAYFNKLECFCFRQQTLAGNQLTEMPLRFMVSPDLPEGIDSLTLSYNLLRVDKEVPLAASQ